MYTPKLLVFIKQRVYTVVCALLTNVRGGWTEPIESGDSK